MKFCTNIMLLPAHHPLEVAEQINWYSELLGGVENLLIFPAMPGDSYTKVDDQVADVLEVLAPK